ncbi:MAG: glucose-1-phosphate thymidylyltransferase RfbA [candidate division WOR-3 bacterium]|nr:glucose-1-phosphate thymidylyltransferase RfbA [candidate division WOR-3 bacterium]MCX7947203.1 glucose-1-phosphate thymidylyltransferase RfbA [candidate division WOR-3 bacterium]MDW8150259.1 glucose-1-phosphate thymidylyltransferase RfbA [candidate division WOR-3 bacterium]
MKGIILAGGLGTRLYPITKVITKQLLPIYDKPLIYYPLSVLMLANIRDILIISDKENIEKIKILLGNGEILGISISYEVQEKPRGIAEAIIIAKDFIEDEFALILGDNLLYGHGLPDILRNTKPPTIFLYYVNDPKRYGIAHIKEDRIVLIEEKPKRPKSNLAIVGLYYLDRFALEVASSLKPSKRNELEIVDVLKAYLNEGKLNYRILGRGFTFIDCGTFDSMLEASIFISTIEKRQGLKIGCIEEVAYRMGFITREQLVELSKNYKNSGYGEYLLKIVRES